MESTTSIESRRDAPEDIVVYKTFKLYCRNGFFGEVTVPEDVEHIEFKLPCRHSGCKRGGVYPHHLFVINGRSEVTNVRPVESIHGNPGNPREILGLESTDSGEKPKERQ